MLPIIYYMNDVVLRQIRDVIIIHSYDDYIKLEHSSNPLPSPSRNIIFR